MPALDPEKRRAASRRYRERKKVEKYGPQAAGVNMSGRHGNHARGSRNGRWAKERMLSSEGYVLIRVGKSHPLAFGNGYAYEHHLVMTTAIGRPLGRDEVVHHRNHDRTDNRLENLELTTRSVHAEHHAEERGRDEMGRFPREFPR